MPRIADQYLSPQGYIEGDTMFPGETDAAIRTRIQTAIEEGYNGVATVASELQDAAVDCWVYYRMFTSVFISLSATPSSAAMADQGSVLYTAPQIANFKTLADSYLAQFNGYLAAGTQFLSQRFQSASVSHKIAWN